MHDHLADMQILQHSRKKVQLLTKLVEPFIQAESGGRQRQGTGLGLVLSAQYVRLMGGELTLESKPGRGSRFSFRVPFQSVPDCEGAPASKVADPNPGPERRPSAADQDEGAMIDPPPGVAAGLAPESVAVRLAHYPDTWLEALRYAVKIGDFVRIGRLLEQIAGQDPALDETLGHWAYVFDQEAFLKALDGQRRS